VVLKAHTKTQEKKRAILMNALDRFVEKGIEQTSIQMICEATETSVGSLYHHFGNKEAIAAAVYIEGMKDFWQLVNNYLDKATIQNEAEPVVKSLVYANIDWISKNKNWARYIFSNRSVVKTKEQKQVLFDISQDTYQRIEDLFLKFINKKQLKNLPLEIFSPIISGPVHDYARHYFSGRYKKSLQLYKEEFAQATWCAVKK